MNSLFRQFCVFCICMAIPTVSKAESLSSLDEEASGEVSYFDSETAASISAAIPVALLAGAGILVACAGSNSSSSSSTNHVHAHTN